VLELKEHPLVRPGDPPDHHPVLLGGAAGVRRGHGHLIPDAALVRAPLAVGHVHVLELRRVPVQVVHQHRKPQLPDRRVSLRPKRSASRSPLSMSLFPGPTASRRPERVHRRPHSVSVTELAAIVARQNQH
jgi:hypothetical protein